MVSSTLYQNICQENVKAINISKLLKSKQLIHPDLFNCLQYHITSYNMEDQHHLKVRPAFCWIDTLFTNNLLTIGKGLQVSLLRPLYVRERTRISTWQVTNNPRQSLWIHRCLQPLVEFNSRPHVSDKPYN